MIYGIGTDIVDIQRMAKAMQNPRFVHRFFSEEERAYFQAKNNRPESVASTFAMKEAVAKALGTGIRNLNFSQIVIIRNALGKPEVLVTTALQVVMDNYGVERLHVSCAHEKGYAIAYAIAEGNSTL